MRLGLIACLGASAFLAGCAALPMGGDAAPAPPDRNPVEEDPLANTDGVAAPGGTGVVEPGSGGSARPAEPVFDDTPGGEETVTEDEVEDAFAGILGEEIGEAYGEDGLGLSGTGRGGGGTGEGTIGLGVFGTIGRGGSSRGSQPQPADPRGWDDPSVPAPAPEAEPIFGEACEGRGAADAASGQGYACVSLLYGTNREPVAATGALDEQTVFGSRPDPRCEPGADITAERYCRLGLMTVSVPDDRQRGEAISSVNRDAVRISDRDRRRHFSIWSAIELSEIDFQDYARIMLEEAMGRMGGEYDNQAIVFVHGFNVRFRDAAFRAAQIKYDLEFPGPVFFYSWPANASVAHYLSDMDDADLSVDALVAFLQLVRNSVPDAEINVIAHSMGTRVFAQALDRLYLMEPDFELNHVFFASGDLDRNLFVEWTRPAAAHMESLTLYTSQSDAAVASSELLRNLFPARDPDDRDAKARIGFFQPDATPPVFTFRVGDADARPQTIDMSDGAFSFFGFATSYLIGRGEMRHSEYMERTPIIEDMSCVLRFGARFPDERHSGMQPAEGGDGGVFWRFDEDGRPTEHCPAPRIE
jgi:pimeloyl-ACP methyl ester carboxylesterase